MKNIIEYKGYFTKIEFSVEDKVLHGKIEGINDLVTFESESASEIEHEFKNAVDDYLELCKDLNQAPDKAYSGTFNVRINPILHRKIALQAIKNDESLNSTVEKALYAFVDDFTQKKVEEIWDMVSSMGGYYFKSTSCSSDVPYDMDYNMGGISYA